jgi:lipopolysaccharide export system protein LptA
MIPQKIRYLMLVCLLLANIPVHAGQHVRARPINLEADEVKIDDARQISIFTGDVRLTQGTMAIYGDQIVVVQDKNGFRRGTATGSPASFHQQREGTDGYVEGSGERIEYDAGSEIMNIFGQAHVKRGQDDVRGDHITYNAKTEVFQVSGSAPRAHEKEQRVRVVIQPQGAAASSPSSTEPLSIKPDTTLIHPESSK